MDHDQLLQAHENSESRWRGDGHELWLREANLSQRPVTRNFGVFFDLRLNKQLSQQ